MLMMASGVLLAEESGDRRSIQELRRRVSQDLRYV